MSSGIRSDIKTLATVGALVTGYLYAGHTALYGTSPSSSLAYPVYRLGKNLCDKMIIHKEAPSFLQIGYKDFNGQETHNLFDDEAKIVEDVKIDPNTFELSDVPKIATRALVASAGGWISLLSKGIDKCAEAFSSTFLPDQLQNDLNSALVTQKETLQKIAQKEQETISNVEALEKMQEQQGEQIVQCNKNAEQQTLLIETLEATLSPVSEEPTLDQYEKIIAFVDQLSQLASEAQLPFDEKRVESLKKILAEHKTQEGLIKDLEEELQALSSTYTEEVDLVEELTSQIEQQILTSENK